MPAPGGVFEGWGTLVVLSIGDVVFEAVSKIIEGTMLVKGLLWKHIENAMMLHHLLTCEAWGTWRNSIIAGHSCRGENYT